MNRSFLLPVIALVAFFFMGWHLWQTNRAQPAVDPPVEPSHSPYVATIAGAGVIEPASENIAVAAVVPGIVTQVAVKVGQRVEAGETLFRLDDRERKADLAIAKARLAQASAALSRLKQMPRTEDVPPSAAMVGKASAEMKARKDELDRMEQLTARNVATQQELIQRQQAFLVARANLDQAEAEHARLLAGAWEEDLRVAESEVELARESVSQAEVEIERLTVKSPIPATILKVDVRPGEYVGTPPNQPLIVLGDISTLHVRVDIDEQDLPRFRAGLPGRGFVRGDAQTELPMTFVRIEPYVQPKRSLTNAGTERVDTRVLQVIYALNPVPAAVYVGQQIDVFLDVGTSENQTALSPGIAAEPLPVHSG